MSKVNAASLRAPARHRRLAVLKDRAEREWIAFRPAAILVAVFAGLVLLDGLLTIGLFGLLEALGLREPPIDPNTLPAGAEIWVDRSESAAADVLTPTERSRTQPW